MSEEKKEWDAAYYRAAAESAERMMEVAGSLVVSSQACARDLEMAARDVEVLERERDEARAERALLTEERNRLRGALERLMLSRDASWIGGHDWEEALDEAAAALAGEGEAPCHYCDYEDQEPCFSAFFGYFYCTRPKGHDGVHVACSESKHAVAMVSVDTTPEKAREP